MKNTAVKWLTVLSALISAGCSPAYYNRRNIDSQQSNASLVLCLVDGGVDQNAWFNCIRNENPKQPVSMMDNARNPTCATPEQSRVIEHCLLEDDARRQRSTTTCSEFLGTVTCAGG